MNAIINLGIAKETEKAVLVVLWSSGNYRGFLAGEKYQKQTAWVPKSLLNILEEKETLNFYNTYHKLRTNAYGCISEGIVKRNPIKKQIKAEVPAWFYKKNLTFGFDLAF